MFFASDGFADVVETFPIHQAYGVVAVGEAFKFVGLVLGHALHEVAGHADVERTAGGTLHDVDVVAMFSAHGNELSSRAESRDLVFIVSAWRSEGL